MFFISFSLNSESIPAKNPTLRSKSWEYRLLLKRQTYFYLPYEYTSLSKFTDLSVSRNTGEIAQNSKVLIPFVFNLENRDKGYKFELSYFEIEIVNPNTTVLQNSNGVFTISRSYLSPVSRSEFELNGYKSFIISREWLF